METSPFLQMCQTVSLQSHSSFDGTSNFLNLTPNFVKVSKKNVSFPSFSADGQPTLLPPEQVLLLNQRSTGMLNNVQRLFSHHMVQTFGCDYSTGGVTLETVQSKLRDFLERRTADGPRHDTYLIFYSGHTHKGTGSWVLAGENSPWPYRHNIFESALISILFTVSLKKVFFSFLFYLNGSLNVLYWNLKF